MMNGGSYDMSADYDAYNTAIANADAQWNETENSAWDAFAGIEASAATAYWSTIDDASAAWQSTVDDATTEWNETEAEASTDYNTAMTDAETAWNDSEVEARGVFDTAYNNAIAEFNTTEADAWGRYNTAVDDADAEWNTKEAAAASRYDTAIAAAEQDWTDAEADARGEYDTAEADANTEWHDSEADAETDYNTAMQTATDDWTNAEGIAWAAYESADVVATGIWQTAADGAWAKYEADIAIAEAAWDSMESGDWSVYQAAVAGAETVWNAAEANAENRYDSAIVVAKGVWTSAENAAWSVFINGGTIETVGDTGNVGSGTSGIAAFMSPPPAGSNLPDGCTVDSRTNFVYDADGNLFGVLDENGYVVWPTNWPPGGPRATVTSLAASVAIGDWEVFWGGAANLRVKLQKQYGAGTVTVLPRLPGANTGGAGSRTTNIPDGFIAGCGGAQPCILVLIVSNGSVLSYHFNTSHDAYATLVRDQALMGNGAHVLLGAGDNTRESNMTLGSVNRFLSTRRADLIVDGLVNSCAIYADNHGSYFTYTSAIRMHQN